MGRNNHAVDQHCCTAENHLFLAAKSKTRCKETGEGKEKKERVNEEQISKSVRRGKLEEGEDE